MRSESEAMEVVYDVLRTFSRGELACLALSIRDDWALAGWSSCSSHALLLYQILFTIEKKNDGKW